MEENNPVSKSNLFLRIKNRALSCSPNAWSVLILVFFGVLTYRTWIKPGALFGNSDWWYFSAERLKEIGSPSIWYPNNNSFGGVNVTLILYPLHLLFAATSIFDSDSRFADQLVLLWPYIIFSAISGFFFFRKLSKNTYAAISGSVLLAFNSYILAINTQGHLLLSFGALGIPFLMFLAWRLLERPGPLSILTLSLCATMLGVFDFRFIYINSGALLLFIVIACATRLKVALTKSFLQGAFFACVAFCLLNIYWILPLITTSSITSNALFDRSLFGSEFFTLLHAFSLHHPFWNNSSVEWFTVASTPAYFWLLPLFAVLSLVFIRKRSSVYFGALMLVGVLLAKQSNEPLPSIYKWLYDHFPGFNAFREASKFYGLVAISYISLITVLFAKLLIKIKNNNAKRGFGFVLVAIVLFFTAWNTRGIASGEIKTMHVSRKLDSDYKKIDQYVSQQMAAFRVLWVPSAPRWAGYTNTNPRVKGTSISLTGWRSLLDTQHEASSLKFIEVLFNHSLSDYLFDISNIKYVLLPPTDEVSETNVFRFYTKSSFQETRRQLENVLSAAQFLRKVDIGTKNIDIYENLNPLPSVFGFSRLNIVRPSERLEFVLGFIDKTLVARPLFVYESTPLNAPGLSYVSSIFGKVDSEDLIAESRLRAKTSGFNEGDNVHLYRNTVEGRLMLTLQRRGVRLYHSSLPLPVFNGLQEKSPTLKTVVNEAATLDLWKRDLMVSFDGQVQELEVGDEVSLGRANNNAQVEIFQRLDTIFENGSFESGSWQERVGDCNKFDSNPDLSMSINKESRSHGKQSIQLEAARHDACISTKGIIKMPGEYLLALDYQSQNSKHVNYLLLFDDQNKSVVSGSIAVKDAGWGRFLRKIEVPEGTKSAKIYLYTKSNNDGVRFVNRYDNVSFSPLRKVNDLSLRLKEGYEKIPVTLKEGENTFEYVDPRYDYKNLLPNPSFETRPWQEKVGDCNRYDDNPQLAMRLNEQEKTDGAKSLELEATRHTACMATTVPIKPGATYLLSFDYQSPNAKQASYYIGFNDPEKTSLKDQLTVTSTAWNSFSNTFTAPKGATSLSLYVYARETDKKTAIINRYDNFKLIEVPDLRDAFYLVSEPERKLIEPKSVDFELINPTKKLVHIKGATTPFFLGMSESYHDQWQLQFQNEKIQGVLKRWWPFAKPDRVADEYHFKLNGFLNAWYIDTDDWCATQGKCTKNADGSYDIEMVIEFWPQRWFYLGLLISGTTLAGCLGYLGYEGVKSIRRRLATRKKELV